MLSQHHPLSFTFMDSGNAAGVDKDSPWVDENPRPPTGPLCYNYYSSSSSYKGA